MSSTWPSLSSDTTSVAPLAFNPTPAQQPAHQSNYLFPPPVLEGFGSYSAEPSLVPPVPLSSTQSSSPFDTAVPLPTMMPVLPDTTAEPSQSTLALVGYDPLPTHHTANKQVGPGTATVGLDGLQSPFSLTNASLLPSSSEPGILSHQLHNDQPSQHTFNTSGTTLYSAFPQHTVSLANKTRAT